MRTKLFILFLNQDNTEKDEYDELKVFYFILFIFFSVILVQKQNEQLLNEELIFRDFLIINLKRIVNKKALLADFLNDLTNYVSLC